MAVRGVQPYLPRTFGWPLGPQLHSLNVPVSPGLGHQLTALCPCVFAHCWYFIQAQPYNIWNFMTSFFHLACFHGSPTHFTAFINSSFLYGQVTSTRIYHITKSSNQLMGIWVAVIFWLWKHSPFCSAQPHSQLASTFCESHFHLASA